MTEAPPATDFPCANCGSPLVRRYCSDCGQAAPRPDDYSLRQHVADFVDQITSIDGKAVRTMWTLVARPGALTIAHLAGRRARFLKPLQLFLLVNVLLFVAAPRAPMFSYSLDNYRAYAPPSPALVARLVQRAEQVGVTPDAYKAAFDGRVDAQRRSLIILFVPALALVLGMLFSWRAARPGVPRRYGEHLIFSLHVLTFIWLALTGWGLLAALSRVTIGRMSGTFILGAAVTLVALTPAYAFFATRRVYHLSGLQALAATGVLAVACAALLSAYRVLLFFTTYYTLR